MQKQSSFKKFISHNRIVITRAVVILLVVFWLFSRSYWSQNSPIFAAFLFMIGSFLVGIAGMGRMWCSLYIAGYKNKKLVNLGPYSIMRNPLYFFSMLGTLGAGFLTQTLTFPLILVTLFGLYYPAVIQREENDLKNIFGKEYEKYLETVPTFFPKLSLYKDPKEYIVKPSTFKSHLTSAIWFVWSIGVIYFLQVLRDNFLPYKFILF
jgi:protein-S-isoprenylcysteine O-methyltransferase Ste14